MDLLAVLSEAWTPGPELAKSLGKTRQAVAKEAQRLKALGFPIESSRSGYRVIPGSPVPQNVLPKLKGRFGRPYHYFGTLKSTQDELRRLAEAGAPEGTVVLAERQTAGRGRQGRRWQSPGGGLYFSLLLRPAYPLDRLPLLPLAAGVGLVRAAGVGGLKWPNDLSVFVDGELKKLGGVLLEAQVLGEELHYALLGVGLNVAEGGLPDEAAGLLRFLPGARRDELLVRALYEIERALAELENPEGFIKRYKLHSLTLYRPVFARWVGEPISGVAVDVEPTGALVVRTKSGRKKRVTAGEVSLVERVSEVRT